MNDNCGENKKHMKDVQLFHCTQKGILQKQTGKPSNGLVWFGTGTSTGPCKHGNELVGQIKCGKLCA